MAAGGAEPWRWPRLDEVEQAGSSFRPTGCDVQSGPAASEDEGAARLMRESREEADRLIEQAHAEAESIRHRAREEAWTEALGDARQRLEAALSECVAEQTAAFERAREALLTQFEAAHAERLAETEKELAGLVAAMAEKVIRRSLEADAGIVLDVVRGVIREAAGADHFTVRVSAPDEELVREAMAELLSATDGAEQLEIVADNAIGPGGCIVETERGRFDARIEAQIELLREEIERVLGGGGGE